MLFCCSRLPVHVVCVLCVRVFPMLPALTSSPPPRPASSHPSLPNPALPPPLPPIPPSSYCRPHPLVIRGAVLLTDVRDRLLFLRQLAVGLHVKCFSSPREKAVLAPCHATSAQSFIKHDSWAGKLSHHRLSARLGRLCRARWCRPAVRALWKRRRQHVQHRLYACHALM